MKTASLLRFVGVAGIVALTATMLQGQTQQKPASDEYLLLGNADRGAGEPWVFINPKDHRNIIVVAMATLNRLPDGETPILPRGTPAATQQRIKELSTPDGSLTAIAVTHDGGDTWTFSQDDLRKTYNKNRCSDSFAGAGPDGKLYMGCLAYLNRGAADYAQGYSPDGEAHYYHGGSAIESSADQGRTWSHPVWVHPALSPSLYAPTVKPVLEQASPWDRPVFVADQQKGTIYVSGSGLAYMLDPATVKRPKLNPSLPGMGYTGYPGRDVSRGHTFLRASHDDGRTWGVIYPIDNDQYPGGWFAGVGGFSAAYGHLAVAYNASEVPAELNRKCPCTVLGTSENDGRTFDHHVLPPLPAEYAPKSDPNPMRAMFGVMVSADPTKEGRYAVARIAGTRILISITEDGGKTWQDPVVAAEIPENAFTWQHAMKYSAGGNLGMIWKAVYPDKSFDLWSAVSKNGGHSFTTVRVSHAVSPPYNPIRGNFMFGDDLSSMDIDADYLYAVWGDNRSGFEGSWFGRVPLSAY